MMYRSNFTRVFAPILLCLFSASAMAAAAQDADVAALTNLGNGVFLEVEPAKFVTFVEETPEWMKQPQWVTIPATFETINETITVQEAYSELKLTPATFADDGSLLQSAQASLIDIPTVTKTITRRVMKTPPRVVRRTVPNMYHPPTRRKKVREALYVFRDEAGTEIARYEDPLFAMRFIERLPN